MGLGSLIRMTTATLVRRFPQPLRSPRLRGGLIGFGGTMASAIVLLAATSFAVAALHEGRVLRGVTVGGVELGGLDRTAAEELLRDSLPPIASQGITLVGEGRSLQLTAGTLGRDYDLAATLDAAFAVGRDGPPLTSSAARLRALIAETSVAPVVTPFASALLEQATARLAGMIDREPVNAAVLTDQEAGVFGVQLGVEGVTVDQQALMTAVSAQASRTAEDVSVQVPLVYREPALSTREAAAAALAANRIAAEIGLEIESDVHPIERATLMGWITFEPGTDGALLPVVDEQAVGEAVAALATTLNREAKDASFEHGSSGGPTGVVPGQSGREVDVEASTGGLLAALRQRADGERVPSVRLTASVTLPALSTEAAEAALPKMELEGTWTTYYIPGISNYYGNNISIPAWDIDGTTLAPGEWFDFWSGIGPVTLERGYGMGGVIINGRTRNTGALAGGICSTSTTLFNAAARAGLEIGDRRNHSYYISRYPLGLDATVYMDDSYTQNMSFRNDTDSPILIRAYAAAGWVRFDVWMVPTGRTVAFTNPVTWNHGSATWVTQTDASLAPGQRVVEQEPHDGFSAQVERYVRDSGGNLVHHDTWVSHYRVVNGIVRVGPASAAAADEPDEPAA